ncbi:MAG: aminotransferase class V-fold PLP-dependent enzyme [Acidobacteria bacterium]|nr:MAG: aminotransferase class V-fold PLP-dependent enzyme [Acidobacteriota bacterium]
MKFETLAVRAGAEPDVETGALAPPIHLSTTFEHGPAAETPKGYIYVRENNPTQVRLQEALAALEGGEEAMAFASGIGAGAAFLQALPPESHVIFADDIYYDFRTIATEFFPGWNKTASMVDLSHPKNLESELRDETKLVWLETPSNPLLKVVDIEAVAAIAHRAGAKVLVDSTFATPALQRPLTLGADAVLQSTTKYLGGHSDVQGGAIIVKKRDEHLKQMHLVRKVLGAVASPFNSWLVLRGIRSLAVRVERQAATALTLARALDEHPHVTTVHYPGLAGHPGHEVASRQMSAFGGILSFEVASDEIDGGEAAAIAVASRLKLIVNATSLGGVETILEHRYTSEGPTSQAPAGLLRMSVGLEDAGDLLDDLRQALDG